MNILIFSIILACLVGASAFFSGSETALFSINATKVLVLKEEKGKRGKEVSRLLRKPSDLLITILIGNMAVNILASSISSTFITHLFGPMGLGISIAGMWFIILIFGEITPKILAIQKNEMLSLLVAAPLSLFQTITLPLRATLKSISDAILRLLGQSEAGKEKALTEKELKTAFKLGHSEGELDELEERILRRIMDFENKSVTAAMTPRLEIVASDITQGLSGVIRLAKKHHLSRIPVFEHSLANVLGVAYVKDLLVNREKAEEDFRSVLRPVLFVPEQQKVGRLFLQLKQKQTSMALVVDEYGTLEGLVTLHDLLEEIVGNVPQRGEQAEWQPLGADSWSIKGSMSLSHFQDLFHVEIPEGDYDTVAGFLIDSKGDLPEVGDSVTLKELEITVQERKGSRLVRLRIQKSAYQEISDEGVKD